MASELLDPQTASANDQQRATNVVRTGPRGATPVLLIHAASLDLTYRDQQIAELAVDHDVIAFDLPGHGATEGSAADWTRTTLSSFVANVALAAGAPRAHVVGLSLGGLIGQVFALDHPERVASLSLIDTAFTSAPAARESLRTRGATARSGGVEAVLEPLIAPWFTAEFVRRRPDVMDRVRRTLRAHDAEVHGAMWDFIGGFDVVEELERLRCPTLVIVGDRDETTPVQTAAALCDAVADARPRVIPNAAHMPPLERTDLVNRHLRAFLATLA